MTDPPGCVYRVGPRAPRCRARQPGRVQAARQAAVLAHRSTRAVWRRTWCATLDRSTDKSVVFGHGVPVRGGLRPRAA